MSVSVDRLLLKNETRERLRVGAATLDRLIKRGVLPVVRRPSPATWVALKLWASASSRRARLGFNPSDRTRIKVILNDASRDPLEAAREKLRQARAHLRPA